MKTLKQFELTENVKPYKNPFKPYQKNQSNKINNLTMQNPNELYIEYL